MITDGGGGSTRGGASVRFDRHWQFRSTAAACSGESGGPLVTICNAAAKTKIVAIDVTPFEGTGRPRSGRMQDPILG
jgi:hypothetical protein